MPIFDNSDEAQAYLDKVHMTIDGQRHSMYSALESLDKDQLVAFRDILQIISNNDESPTAAYFNGITSQMLSHRFNICPACYQDHNEILEQSGEADGSEPATDQGLRPWWEPIMDQLNEYNMEPINPEASDDFTLRCRGCGMTSVSLQDRMLRQPGIDGCSGCQIKSGHG